MKAKRIAMLAATGSAAFFVGFAAVGLMAIAAEAIAQTSAERAPTHASVEPVNIEPQVQITPEPAPSAGIVDEWPTAAVPPGISGGTYFADDYKPPRSFRDLEFFEFEMYDYTRQLEDGSYGVPIPPKGTIRVGKTTFKLTRIAVGIDSISFQTDVRNGVSYRFTGKFNNFDYCETEEEQPDVVGRMIKLVNGKWAAEASMSFFSEGCGC